MSAPATAAARFAELPFPRFSLLAPRRISSLSTLSSRRTPLCAAGSRQSSSSEWLQQWPPLEPAPAAPATSIDRIVHRLRNLTSDDASERDQDLSTSVATVAKPTGEERLSDLLHRQWGRPDKDTDLQPSPSALPWEREKRWAMREGEESVVTVKKVKAPTLAELTIEDGELRRLRTLGMRLRERLTVPKAGVTQAMVAKIHDVWRRNELVRLKFHEDLAQDMKTAHELVERRTGGLIIWRAGSVMVVYRGSNYRRPTKDETMDGVSSTIPEGDLFVPDIASKMISEAKQATSLAKEHASLHQLSTEDSNSMSEEEHEFNQMLDELGPRFVDWWGTGILPVDADLLPQTIPGFKTPLRMLPTGMRSRLTNAELTNLRKLAKKLPCHFALGRNRHHQGLAAAILKLWEKSLVAKIAVKRGIQNTNNKLMAEELKMLTGGTLLLRNKYHIVIFRGKDFLPTSVASALAERQELAENIQNEEESTRDTTHNDCTEDSLDKHVLAGTLAEFKQAQARWGREISNEELEEAKKAASMSQKRKLFKRLEHKLSIAQAKKLRAERLLAKIEASMIPANPSDDHEVITDEERSVFRRIGLRMKSYLTIGVRGVFDGIIENMHLHWKHREVVKLISKQKTFSFVEDTARLLEYESNGILVAIERVPKGYALIYYRGKNYRRPVNIRPTNLLTKAKALKRAVAMQRHEALSEHISQLESNIQQINDELGSNEMNTVISRSHQGGSKVARDEVTDDNDDVDDADFTESDDEFDYDSEDDWVA